MGNICAKDLAVIDKISIIKKSPQISYINKIVILSILGPYKFYDSDMPGISFLIFASCEKLRGYYTPNQKLSCLARFFFSLLQATHLQLNMML